MKRLTFMILSLFMIFALAACGQEMNNDSEEIDTSLGTDLDPNEQTPNEEEEQPTTEAPEDNEQPMETPAADTLETVHLYFSDVDLMNNYRIEVPTAFTKDEKGAIAALELWISGPTQEGLHSLVPATVSVQSLENIDGVAHISFSSQLQEANLGSTGEMYLIDQIVMVVEQFGYSEVMIYIDGEVQETLLGHVSIDEPLKANSPTDYDLFQK